MKLSKSQIKKMSESFAQAKTQQVAQKAVTKNGILASAEDGNVIQRMSPANFAFTIDVDKEAVANQKMSGRCWMFACLNTLRFHIEKDREVDWLISAPMQDGGDWDMICALVKKYGVMPHQAMAETHCTNDTAEVNTVLSNLLRQDAIKLRSMAREGKDTEATQLEMLDDVYRILATCFGEPPEKFDFQYEDSKGAYHADFGLTPLEFLEKYVKVDLDDYIGVINVPGAERPYNRMYTIQDSDQIPERENLYLNVPMPDLKELVIKQLKSGEPIWFGSDVLQHCDRNAGVMAKDLFDLDAMFGIKMDMNKEQRYDMKDSLPTHAMLIAGVDMDKDGKPSKWKIENSWGTENHGQKTGNNGYFVCDDWWFDNFVYEVAIRKDLLTSEQQAALKTEPIVWPFWNSFNPVLGA